MARSGKATLTVAIGGEYTGRNAVKKAEADLRALREAARQAGGGVADIMKIGDAAVDLGSNIEVAGQKFSDFGTKLTKATAPIAAIGAASVKLAADYESSVAKVYTIMDKQAMSTEAMSKNILDLSTATGKSATELAEASYQALSASVETSKVGGFVEQSVKLAKAGFTETATAVDTLTTVINAYGMSADDAAMISDRLVQTQNKGKTTVDELASSMGSVIPTASAYNVSLDNLCSGYVALTRQGIDTANATTALNGMMTELADGGSTVAKVLRQQTGKTFGQLMSDGSTLADVIETLSASVGGNSEAFANLWANVRASKGALAIANAGAQDFRQTMQDMADSAGLVDSALEDLQTPAAKAQKALNALKNTGIELGEEMLGAAGPSIDDLAEKARGLYGWFSKLDDGTKNAIVTVGALAVAAGPVSVVFGKGMTAVGGFVTSVGKGVQAVGTFTAAMKAAEVEMKAAGATSVSLGAKMRSAAEATGLASKAATMLKGSLAMIGISAAVAAVAALVDMYSKWQEHVEQVEKATSGLESSMDAAATAAEGYAASMDKATDAMSGHKKSVDDVISAQAELAGKLTEEYSEVGRNSAMVEQYAATLKELASKGRLTADEQTKLVEAARAFSSITGESVGVVDAETGALDRSLSAIMATADAYRDRATAAVSQENIVQADQAVKDAEEALAQAKEEYANAERASQQMASEWPELASSYVQATAAAEQKVKDMTDALESARAYQERAYASITKVGAASLAASEAAEDLGVSMDDVAESTADAEEASKAYQKQLDAQYKAQQRAYDRAYKSQQKALQAEEKALQKSNQNRIKEAQKSLDAQHEAIRKQLDARYDDLKESLEREEKALKDSNDARLDELKKSQDAEVKLFEKRTDEKIKLMEKEYEASVKRAENSRDERVKAIDDQIAALEAEDDAAEEAARQAEREQKQAELQKAVNTSKSSTARARAEKALSDYLAEIAAEDAREQRQATIDQLNDRKQAIKDETAAQKDALKERYEDRSEAYEQQRETELAAIKSQNEAEAEALREKLEAQETALSESNEARLAALKEANDAQLDALKEANDAQLEAMREANSEQEEAMRESHQERLEAMRESQQDALSALKESQQEQLEAYKKSRSDQSRVLDGMASDAKESAETAWENIDTAIDRNSPEIQKKVEYMRNAVLKMFKKTEDDAAKFGGSTGGKFGEGIASKERFVGSGGGKIGQAAVSALGIAISGVGGIGMNFALGFANGMCGVDLWTIAWNVGVNALDAIKRALGVASPSKEAMWVGEMYGKGIAIGMGKTEREIAAQSARLTDAMTLEPTPYGTYAVPGTYERQAARQAASQFTWNVTIQVMARNEDEAVAIGRSVGDSLYEEFARRERQLNV